MENKIIGGRIAEARKKINISQAQLAQQLFISPQAVGKWERGESLPDIITINRLAKILGVDLNYFSENFQSPAGELTAVEPLVNLTAEPAAKKNKDTILWDMSRGNWMDADFSGLKNLQEKFIASNMKGCKFVGSDLSGLLLKSNNVDSCDFTGSDISNSHIQTSYLLNNCFKDCSMKETEFSESYITNCDFSGTDLTGTVLKSGGFQNNAMTGAVLNRTSFTAMKIIDLVFDGHLENCYFEYCDFTRVTFRNATLTNTFFKCRSLKKIKFIDCQADRMTYEFLKNGKADLSGITLLTT
jgi:uncharacterized protein YjbI with pentapeptide repeats